MLHRRTFKCVIRQKTTSGPVAQLGERYTGSVEVDGSIPFGSTSLILIQIGEHLYVLTKRWTSRLA